MRFMILIIFICIVIIVAIFSIQNSQPISISIFTWSSQTSLAIIVFLSVALGFVIGLVSSFVFRVSKKAKT
ncbi:MAG: LapA family protein, partial [Syntrophorhabdaceae bacterium]